MMTDHDQEDARLSGPDTQGLLTNNRDQNATQAVSIQQIRWPANISNGHTHTVNAWSQGDWQMDWAIFSTKDALNVGKDIKR